MEEINDSISDTDSDCLTIDLDGELINNDHFFQTGFTQQNGGINKKLKDSKDQDSNLLETISIKCPECKYNTFSVNKMQIHSNKKHPKYHKCIKCPFQTKQEIIFTNHVRCHEIPGKFKCVNCTFQTQTKNILIGHKKLHSRQIKMVEHSSTHASCPLCSFAGTVNSTIAHFKNHGIPHQMLNDIIICPLCAVQKKIGSSFGKHARRHIQFSINTKRIAKEKIVKTKEKVTKKNIGGKMNQKKYTQKK